MLAWVNAGAGAGSDFVNIEVKVDLIPGTKRPSTPPIKFRAIN